MLLFIGCRIFAKLLVLDTETGKTVAALDVVGDTDDLFYDAANKRIHQSEDVKAARYGLDAARSNLKLIRSQTATAVTQMYRATQFAYESAQLYKESLIPLADQSFQVALTAYQLRKIDFLTLSTALQSSYAARASYLQSSNQFFASRVALEHAIGASLPQ